MSRDKLAPLRADGAMTAARGSPRGRRALSEAREDLAAAEWRAYVEFSQAHRDAVTGEQRWSAADFRRSEDLAADWNAAASAAWARGDVMIEGIVPGETDPRPIDAVHAFHVRFSVDRDELRQGQALFVYGVSVAAGKRVRNSPVKALIQRAVRRLIAGGQLPPDIPRKERNRRIEREVRDSTSKVEMADLPDAALSGDLSKTIDRVMREMAPK